ncbi:unnamed protein product [Xylocopa violacea]|uniref:Uncharacterized protein n=1 Tax=Xylocopa violacea TaxID=135666 RepID=A0ABP1PBK4_XYLVO
MLLRKWFSRKKTKPETEEPLEEKDDVPDPSPKLEEPPKHIDANVIYPFHDVKATSFPPPLSLDASVYTDPQAATATLPEDQKENGSQEKKEKEATQADEKEKSKEDEIADETKDDKKIHLDAYGTCDLKTCAKEKCSPETCEQPLKKTCLEDSKDKINHVKLTEMINSSIKEAMQTIVKQCRMVFKMQFYVYEKQDEEQDVDKKPKEELDKSVCYVSKKTSPVKVKREYRPHTIKEQMNNRSRTVKPCQLQEKYNNARVCSKRMHERNSRSRSKKENIVEEAKKKRHSKSASNVKTDNRRMTGNVNIYICSEATENAQAISKQKKPQPCTESSSETTTEQSKISSSKLVTCIRNRRRKSKEQNSLDFPTKTDEASDNSTSCSCVSKRASSSTKLETKNRVDVCNNIDTDICAKSTESTLPDCECDETNISDSLVAIDKSDSTFERSKFVVCEKTEKPCSTIYPAKHSSTSESEGWSSRSACSSRNADYASSEAWSLEPNFDICSNETEKRGLSKRALESMCKCHKKDRESVATYSIRCNCKNKKRLSKAVDDGRESWLICDCIEEEEEEKDVCVDSREFNKLSEAEKEKVTACRKASEDEESAKFVPCTKEFTDLKEEPEKLQKELPEDVEHPEKGTDEAEKPKISEEEQVDKLSAVQETDQEAVESLHVPPMLLRRRKLIRPETVVLKTILKQQTLEATDQKLISETPVKEADLSEQTAKDATIEQPNLKVESQVSPNILKKFNLRNQPAVREERAMEENQKPPPEKSANALEEKTLEETSEGKDTKNFQGKLRESFLFKSLKKMIGKAERSETKAERSMENVKIVQPASADGNADKTIEIPETGTEVPSTNTETKEAHEGKEKLVPSKMHSYLPLKMKKDKTEPGTVTSTAPSVNEGNEQANKNNPTTDASNSIKGNTAPNVDAEERRDSKLLTVNDKKNSSVSPTQNATVESSRQENSKTYSKVSDSQEKAKRNEFHEPMIKSRFEKTANVREKKEFEPRRSATHEEKPVRKMHVDAHYGKETITTSRQPDRSQSRTICVNSKYAMRNEDVSERFTGEGNACNCRCVPMPRYNVEPVNYPKSCLKQDRQCYHIDSRETTCSIPCYDTRNWEECGCRKLIACNGCCRPRNECSCRRTKTCVSCCRPKNKCRCKSIQETQNACGCMKSMFCLYCDNPRDKCACKAPVEKCSRCGLSADLCVCGDEKTICDGRAILGEPDDDRTMYITAWKPREEVRRYFSRSMADARSDSINECCCCEKLKPHNSDDLPYQRLSVFSDVMDELQQKLSGSTCCTRCKKIPCCCSVAADRDDAKEERRTKYRVRYAISFANSTSIETRSKRSSMVSLLRGCVSSSPKTRRKIIAVCMEKSRNRLSSSCKCEVGQAKPEKQKKIIVALCCACKATPCRCGRSKSNQKKPRAKCYYCKNSPCVCIAARERSKPRPCRCTDSPCRAKEKESVPCGTTPTKPKNNDEKTICPR